MGARLSCYEAPILYASSIFSCIRHRAYASDAGYGFNTMPFWGIPQ